MPFNSSVNVNEYVTYLERESFALQQLQQKITLKMKEVQHALSGIFSHQHDVLHRWFCNKARFNWLDQVQKEAQKYEYKQEERLANLWIDRDNFERVRQEILGWLQEHQIHYTRYHRLVQDKQHQEYLLNTLEKESLTHHRDTIKAAKKWLKNHKKYEPYIHIPLPILQAMRDRNAISRWWHKNHITALENEVYAMPSEQYATLERVINDNLWQDYHTSIYHHEEIIAQHDSTVLAMKDAIQETIKMIQQFEEHHQEWMNESRDKLSQLRCLEKRISQIDQVKERWEHEKLNLENYIIEQWFDKCCNYQVDDTWIDLYEEYSSYKETIHLRSEQHTQELEGHLHHWQEVHHTIQTVRYELEQQKEFLLRRYQSYSEYSRKDIILGVDMYPISDIWSRDLAPLWAHKYHVDVTHALTLHISPPDFPSLKVVTIPRYRLPCDAVSTSPDFHP